MMRMTIALAAACMLVAAPALAQTPATPTGKSDTKSSGMMKKGDSAKSHRTKKKHMM